MAANALERIAILRNLASEIIAEIELLAASNPNLIRLRADLINSDKLHISEAWDEETLIRYAYYWLKQNDELRIGWGNAPHHPRSFHSPTSQAHCCAGEHPAMRRKKSGRRVALYKKKTGRGKRNDGIDGRAKDVADLENLS